MWTCKPCKVEIPIAAENMERIRRHLATKKHARLKNACPRCSSLRLRKIEGETWDRDGIRNAKKCDRCKTEFKSYSSGIIEKTASEYTGEWPEHIKQADAQEFDQIARARGYVKAPHP